MYRREFQKTSNIVRALCQFYLLNGCPETNITVLPFEAYSKIKISGKVEISESILEEVVGWLNQPKTSEVEYYYDDLLASALEDNELSLLGLMIDYADISYQEGVLEISISRTFESTD